MDLLPKLGRVRLQSVISFVLQFYQFSTNIYNRVIWLCSRISFTNATTCSYTFSNFFSWLGLKYYFNVNQRKEIVLLCYKVQKMEQLMIQIWLWKRKWYDRLIWNFFENPEYKVDYSKSKTIPSSKIELQKGRPYFSHYERS